MMRALLEGPFAPSFQRGAAIVAALAGAVAVSGHAPSADATAPLPPGPAECAAVMRGGTSAEHRFLVVYSQGPAWRAGRPVSEQPMPDHLPFVRQLFDAGILVSAGPFLDDTGGAMVVRADSLVAAEQIVACDPAVRGGVMVGTVKQWRMIDWARDAAARSGGG